MEETNQEQTQQQELVSPGSDVDLIEVYTPNFFARHFLHLLAVFGAGFLIFWFIFNVYLTPIYIKGESMQPTINADSRYNDIVYYRAKEAYDIGEIVIVDASDYISDLDNSIIKRLIAKGGQKVSIEMTSVSKSVYTATRNCVTIYYKLLIDDEYLEEDYILDQNCRLLVYTDRLTDQFASNSDYVLLKQIFDYLNEQTLYNYALVSESHPVTFSFELEDDQLFVCGDNRNNSTDSRYFGPIKTKDVIGSVAIHVAHGQNILVQFWKYLFSQKQIAKVCLAK